jgi:hypothetical protein
MQSGGNIDFFLRNFKDKNIRSFVLKYFEETSYEWFLSKDQFLKAQLV